MGMEIIRLGESGSKQIAQDAEGLSKLSYATHRLNDAGLSIWLMNSATNASLIPWWGYSSGIDDDLRRLNDLWSVTSAQGFFDCLFLSQFKKFVGQNLYTIAPGYLRTEGWDKLPENARASYLRGQGCVYRLEGAYSRRLDINWVPFAQPQSLIKDPAFNVLWPLFVASRNDDVATSLGFFSLSDARKLPLVVNLLIQPDDNRSMKLADIVDWYGLYSSPVTPDFATSAVIYTKHEAVMARVLDFQQKMEVIFEQVQSAMAQKPSPDTAFRILSRLVAI